MTAQGSFSRAICWYGSNGHVRASTPADPSSVSSSAPLISKILALAQADRDDPRDRLLVAGLGRDETRKGRASRPAGQERGHRVVEMKIGGGPAR